MPLAKLMFAVKAKPGLTRAEALEHLRDRHAPLVAASLTNRRRLRTYIQNHAIDASDVPGLTDTFDWIIESWRDMSVRLPEPPEAADAIALREDEARFPDRATLLPLMVVEEPVWEANPDSPLSDAPVKLFSYARRTSSLPQNDFVTTWHDRASLLADDAMFRSCVTSFVRNRPVPGPGRPLAITAAPSAAEEPPYDAVDIWRFRDTDALRRLMDDDQFRAAYARYQDGIFDPATTFHLATSENIVFDDARIDPANR